jgi:hypothetical protein
MNIVTIWEELNKFEALTIFWLIVLVVLGFYGFTILYNRIIDLTKELENIKKKK